MSRTLLLAPYAQHLSSAHPNSRTIGLYTEDVREMSSEDFAASSLSTAPAALVFFSLFLALLYFVYKATIQRTFEKYVPKTLQPAPYAQHLQRHHPHPLASKPLHHLNHLCCHPPPLQAPPPPPLFACSQTSRRVVARSLPWRVDFLLFFNLFNFYIQFHKYVCIY
jgi:hypothetical protein